MKHCYLMVAVVAAGMSQVQATELFVAPFGGYSFAASELDVLETETEDSGTLKVAESANYGVMLGFNTKDPGNVYFLYSRQDSDLRTGGNFSDQVVTDITVDYFHVGGTLFFPNGDFKPYVTASLGLTHMSPTGQYSNESRFSIGFGGGIEYVVAPSVSLFADVRGYGTFMSSDSSLFCSDGFCKWTIDAETMWQGQANAGIKFTF